ncbi:MAG: helical backbone metal receptor [Anaerolineales bacterium]|nr:helical backbone metal receptor [Anaerolineales bacterium]
MTTSPKSNKYSKLLSKILITILISLIMCSCKNIESLPKLNTPSREDVAISDRLGREITSIASPNKIVSLAASNTEILYAINADTTLVGRDEYSDYPKEALKIQSIGSLYPQVNTEVIVNLQPDLVLAAGITNPDDVTALEKLGLTVFTTNIASDLDDIYEDIINVGIITGYSNNATNLVETMKSRVQTVQDNASTYSAAPSVYYEIDASEPSKPWTPGHGSLVDMLITTAGGTNIGAISDDPYWQISLEQLIYQDPDIIVLGSSKYGGQTKSTVLARSGWETLKAVRTGQIYEFDDDLVSRPGPRIVDGLETLANIIIMSEYSK